MQDPRRPRPESAALSVLGGADDAVEALHRDTTSVRGAGGIVYRVNRAGRAEVLLVHRPSYDDWTFPKGKHRGRDRHLEFTALREVEEETGQHCVIDRSAGTVHYVDHRSRPKTVWYWLMRSSGGEFTPPVRSDGSVEVDEARWVTLDVAVLTLSYRHDRDLMLRAGPLIREAVVASSRRPFVPRVIA